LLIAAIIGLVALAVRKGSQQREEWHGLTETDARERLDQRLPTRMPEDRRAAVTDKIVERMRDRGVLADEVETDIGLDVDLTDQPVDADEVTAPTV
jgi:hypothetical protein